jgi:hypothetical protein
MPNSSSWKQRRRLPRQGAEQTRARGDLVAAEVLQQPGSAKSSLITSRLLFLPAPLSATPRRRGSIGIARCGTSAPSARRRPPGTLPARAPAAAASPALHQLHHVGDHAADLVPASRHQCAFGGSLGCGEFSWGAVTGPIIGIAVSSMCRNSFAGCCRSSISAPLSCSVGAGSQPASSASL